MTDQKDIEKIARKFEEKFGSDCLLKAGFSTMNKILVQKGICTQQEIFDQFLVEIQNAIKVLTKDLS